VSQGPDEHGGRRWNATRNFNKRNGFTVRWGEYIGNIDCPLMRRWLIETPVGSLRVHHFLHDDDTRALHDHPWWFVTFPLGKGYIDVTHCRRCGGKGIFVRGGGDHGEYVTCDCDDGFIRTRVEPWRFTYRPANHLHAVETDDCWTLIVTGRKARNWGFLHPLWGWMESRPFFHRFGFAPCQD
jgi:hypothetical protein